MALTRGRLLLYSVLRNQNKFCNVLNKEQRLAPVKIFSCGYQESHVFDDDHFDFSQPGERRFRPQRHQGRSEFRGRGPRETRNDFNFNSQKVVKQEIPDLVKNTYIEGQITGERSQDDIQEFMNENNIIVSGKDIPKPILTLEEAKFSDGVRSLMENEGIEKPFPIQGMTWPVVMSGRDCVGVAQTGSGKTLSYILPALFHIVKNKQQESGEGPRAVVMVPTRELAIQVGSVCEAFGRPANVRSALAYGGTPRNYQLSRIRGSEILIATPGRLNDFLNSSEVDLKRCTYLVLDEADRMLDMGFEPQIRNIVDNIIATNRQTVMWSATWPHEIRRLAHKFLDNPVNITVGDKELKANSQIEQKMYMLSDREKFPKLIDILEDIASDPAGSKTLIFSNTKIGADKLQDRLRGRGLPALCIHGDFSQKKRDSALNAFRNRSKVIMIATDVVARGIDISDIAHVVNYDMPRQVEDYVHRIGRTARANNTGKSYSFITMADYGNVGKLISIMEDAGQPVDPSLRAVVSGSRRRSSGKGNRNQYTSSFSHVRDEWQE